MRVYRLFVCGVEIFDISPLCAAYAALFLNAVMVCIFIEEQSIAFKRFAAMKKTSNEYCSHLILRYILANRT